MDKLEKMIATIMKECEADGEPVTYEEAKEMAEMEMNAPKRYEQKDKPKKKVERVRKVDNEKAYILKNIKVLIEGMLLNKGESADVQMKTETELSFNLGGNSYTLKLTKHRKK
jgi:hypothetical protein